MGLFSKTTDYNLILEKILDSKRFSANVKSLLLSMLYKIETSYSDYSTVKKIGKPKEKVLEEIIITISEHLESIEMCEPDSDRAKFLKSHNVIAVTNELEKSALVYPTESSLLYAIADIEPKFFYIEDFIFKKEFQELLVEGNNYNILEILEDFSGWSWNPKSVTRKEYISNLVYQNLIMLFGLEFLETCKNSQTTEYDIVKTLKKFCPSYFHKLTEVLYIKNKSKRLENRLSKEISELKKYDNPEKFLEKAKKKVEVLQKEVDKFESIISNESKLKKSFMIKNSKLEESKRFKNIETYKTILTREMYRVKSKIEELNYYINPTLINNYKIQLDFYNELYKSDKTLEQAVIELEEIFIKILYKKSKEIQTRDEFIDIIYKVRYFRNISISKEKSIKDIEILEEYANKLYSKIITFGTKKSFIRMISYNVGLNSKIITACLDSKSMELENLKIKIYSLGKSILGEVYENKIFEKRIEVPFNVDNPELQIKKNRIVNLFI